MESENRLGFVGIIIEDREHCSQQVNDLLSSHSEIILARTGIPNIKDNITIITLVVNSSTDEIGKLTGRLGAIQGVQVKSGLSKK